MRPISGPSIMRLSMSNPTPPCKGIGGARWGFDSRKVSNSPVLTDEIVSNPLYLCFCNVLIFSPGQSQVIYS